MKRLKILAIALATAALFSASTANAASTTINYNTPLYYRYRYYTYYSYYYNRYTQKTYSPNTYTSNTNNTIKQYSQPATENTVSSADNYALSQDEQKMISYINSERTKRGLSELNINPQLSKIAHLKAEDMLNNNYFSHTSPTYGSPFDMMKKFGISYTMAGENIAKNTDVYKAHVALMNSEGHRANILNSSYTDVGVGVVHDNSGGIIVVEMFIKK